uniref:Beta-lactamase (EC) n=1 Tax=Ganoderma boninense TaxID=34458 RepID=A0A5K1K2N9_9APHY|nr:Beta-lactamase (EC [Ganoderma boninense]
MPFSNSPLQQEPQFYPAINQPPFLIDQPSLHAAVPDNLGQTGMPSQFYNHGWAPKYASAPAQDPASPSGYALLNPTTMAVPIPEFIPEGIQKCLFSFREHLETHKPDRKRFDCDWHGCYKKFTRSRDQLRHIAEDHLGTRAKQPSRAKLTGRRKGGQKQKD